MNIEAYKRGLRILMLFSSLVFAIIILFVLAIVFHTYFLNPSYMMSIEREYSTPEEELAINISEAFNYTETFDIGRFDNSKDPGHQWPNVIDREVIEHYSDRVRLLENNSRRVRVKLDYTVNSAHFSKAEINFSSYGIRMKMDYDDDRAVVFEDPDNVVHIGIKYLNDSSIMEKIEPTDYSFNSSGYLVDMHFQYYEYTGLKAGYSKELRQVVVLGDD